MSGSELAASGKDYTPPNRDPELPAPSLSLPSGVFQASGTVSLAFSAYSTPSLFPVRDMDPSFAIASPVLGAIIHDMDTSSLNQNVTITLPIQNVSFI